MLQATQEKKQLNPRDLLLQPDGKQKLMDMLRNVGRYVPQERAMKALINAIRRRTPLLTEGPAGVGKTALGEALAEAFGLRLFYLQCMDGLTIEDILFKWDQNAQTLFVNQQISHGVPLVEAQQAQWTFDFLVLGEVLEGFHYSYTTGEPCIIIVDEIDKLLEKDEVKMLQIFSRGYARVPRLKPDSRVGMLPEMAVDKRNSSFPIVFLTSNNMGSGVCGPMRSRSRYTYIKYPKPLEELHILHTQVPTASPNLLCQMVKFMTGIRKNGGIKQKPGLRESIEFLQTLVDDSVEQITAQVIEDNVDCLAKTESDVENFLSGLGRFENDINVDDKELMRQVQSVFQKEGKSHRKA